MADNGWERRQDDSERLWGDIRDRIAALEQGAAEQTAEELAAVWRQRAVELSRAADRDREQSDVLKIVVFRLGEERYAVPITAVREIQKVGRVTPVSTAPAFVAGVINLRGVIMSVLDLRSFLGQEPVRAGERARILVTEGAGMVLGFLVEEVEEIVDVPAREVKPPLSPAKGITEDYVAGIVPHRGGMAVLIDLEKVLRNPRIIVDEVV
jgi:purine-binding chemotaxis protein CheW